MDLKNAVKQPLTDTLHPTKIKSISLFHPLSRRFHMLLLIMFAFFAIVSMRINLGIAITCMINSTAITIEERSKSQESSPSMDTYLNESISGPEQALPKCVRVSSDGNAVVNDYGGTLIWDTKVQGWLFSSVFYGSLITILPGGYLADTQSPKLLIVAAAFFWIIGTAATPYIAVNYGWLPLCFCRVVMGAGDGFLMPSVNKLISFWIPNDEKSTAASIHSTGFALATIIGFPTFAYLCSTDWGWPSIFYGCAIFGVLWLIVWILAASKSPFEPQLMLERERLYLYSKPELASRPKTQKVKIPFKSIFTSLPVYSLLVVGFSINLIVTFLHSYQPSFFKEVLFLPPINNGLFVAAPPFLELFFKFAWSIFLDKLKQKKILHPTTACKISQGLSGFFTTILFILLAYLPNCEQPYVTLGLFICLAFSLSFTVGGFFTSMLSIAPLYTGVLSSATMLAGICGRVSTPLLVSYFNKTGTLEEWRPIFFIIAITTSLSTIFFVMFSSAEVQPWAKTPVNPMEMEGLRKENQVEVESIAADMLP